MNQSALTPPSTAFFPASIPAKQLGAPARHPSPPLPSQLSRAASYCRLRFSSLSRCTRRSLRRRYSLRCTNSARQATPTAMCRSIPSTANIAGTQPWNAGSSSSPRGMFVPFLPTAAWSRHHRKSRTRNLRRPSDAVTTRVQQAKQTNHHRPSTR